MEFEKKKKKPKTKTIVVKKRFKKPKSDQNVSYTVLYINTDIIST